MQNYVKTDILDSQNIKSIDLKISENLVSYEEIIVGCATKRAIKECQNFKERDILEFKKECRLAYAALCEKILEKSPVNYKLVKGISCFDPRVAKNLDIGLKRLSITLDILLTHNWITGINADKIQS